MALQSGCDSLLDVAVEMGFGFGEHPAHRTGFTGQARQQIVKVGLDDVGALVHDVAPSTALTPTENWVHAVRRACSELRPCGVSR